MKDIKFRAWDKLNNEMIVAREFPFWTSLRDDKMVVMQFTGLKDKNGRDIYEGDVVENLGRTGTVEWNRAAFVVNMDDWREDFYPLQTDGRYRGDVIGNIWENPELISKEV